jgi:hypothetical protein
MTLWRQPQRAGSTASVDISPERCACAIFSIQRHGQSLLCAGVSTPPMAYLWLNWAIALFQIALLRDIKTTRMQTQTLPALARYFFPAEVKTPFGDTAQAKCNLGWMSGGLPTRREIAELGAIL